MSEQEILKLLRLMDQWAIDNGGPISVPLPKFEKAGLEAE